MMGKGTRRVCKASQRANVALTQAERDIAILLTLSTLLEG